MPAEYHTLGIMARYDPLHEFLRTDGSRRITMTVEQIGLLVGGLPRSAYEHQAWWANHDNPLGNVWINAGYRVDSVDQASTRVAFEKSQSALHG